MTDNIYMDDGLELFSGYLNNHTYSQLIVLTDAHCNQHCFSDLENAVPEHLNLEVVIVEPGEESKSLQTCEMIWNRLLELQADRKILLINLGGGMITDLGGFISSTWKRGVDFVHVPTSLLGMVDASIGSKTGINFKETKNVIGSFTDPKAVFVSKHFLKTLPKREYTSGFAEVLKHGLVSNKSLWNRLVVLDHSDVDDYLNDAMQVKIGIVNEDHFEEGRRKILNFGHTIGHAIESYCFSQDSAVLHGEAVAAGMICEAYLSKTITGLSEVECNKVIETIQQHFEKIPFGKEDIHSIIEYMKNDKKNNLDKFQFSLLNEIGSCDINVDASIKEIESVLTKYIQL